jgi:hypothetical protein
VVIEFDRLAICRSDLKGSVAMSFLKSVMTATVAVSMIAVPTVVQAAQADRSAVSKLSVRAAPAVRQGVSKRGANSFGGSSVIIAVLAAAAIVAGIVVAADGNKVPKSPG